MSVALPVPQLIGGSQKIGVVPGYAHTLFPHKILYAYHADYLYMCTCFRDFRLEFRVGVANLQSREKGGHRGLGMVPFERALVSSCHFL